MGSILKRFSLLMLVASVQAAELPNISNTPGKARSVTVQELCTTKTSTVRNVPDSLKNKVFKAYGMSGNDRSVCKEGYEIDHLVSLELGGDNDQLNLWPQSYCGVHNAHDKDKLENELHRQVCKGQITLIQAQNCIARDWVLCYKQTMKTK
jgi:hypothetical protein